MDDLLETDVWHLNTQNGHSFEVVKRGTDDVVDYFTIAAPERDLDVRFDVGPDENPPPFKAKILNGFPYPVSLYWVRDQDEEHTRELVGNSLPDVHEFDTFLGHRFEIVKIDSGEVVNSFEITGGDPGRHFIASVRPAFDEIPNNANENAQNDGISVGSDEL